MPHVLIDRQHDAGPFTRLDEFPPLGKCHCQRLLRENPADVIGVPEHLANHVRLILRRHADVDDRHLGIRQQVVGGLVDARDSPHGRDLLGSFPRARRDSHHPETGLPIGDEVAVAHDEPRPDHPDAEAIEPRFERQPVVEIKLHGRVLREIASPFPLAEEGLGMGGMNVSGLYSKNRRGEKVLAIGEFSRQRRSLVAPTPPQIPGMG